jgi:hypothetical protein
MATIATQPPLNPNTSVLIDGKKFLWDGQVFATSEDAARQSETYKKDNFDVQMVEVSGSYLLYTRRVVKEIVVTAPQ